MKFKYQDPELSPQERTLDLLSRMTLEEKVGQMTQISYSSVDREEAKVWVSQRFAGSFFHIMGDDAQELQNFAVKTRLGIPLLFGIDAVHGHTFHNGATIFPSQLAMACSWNPDLIEQVGRVTAKEVAADGLHWTFSPVLCIGRDLRWGRIDETFGEDPYLIGVLASAMIRGYQGKKLSDPDSILACAKHFLAYGESGGGRDSCDTEATFRKIREIFLPPFQKAIEAGCATVMAAYQSIDGVPVSANSALLRGILKDELNFSGFVVTDWKNTDNMITYQNVAGDIREAVQKAIISGNDMIMNTLEFYDTTVQLVKEGIIPESLIDEAVKRVLYYKFGLGLFDGKWQQQSNPMVFGCPEHQEVNLRMTRESIVLLENRNHTLPLANSVKKVAVIGPNADDIQAQLGDWTYFSHPVPHPDVIPIGEMITVLQGIKELGTEMGIEVTYHRGCDVMDPDDQDIEGAIQNAENADIVVAVVGDCLAQNGEIKDRADLSLSGAQQKLLECLKSVGKPLIVVLVTGKPLAVPWIAQNADAVIEAFNPGQLGGRAIAETIYGKLNPGGKLPISFPYHSGQLPVYYNQLPGWHSQKYMDLPAEPLYSFGYGMSYTRYRYSNLQLSQSVCSPMDTVIISVDVTNAGERDGIETVQLYVNDLVSSIVTPVKELKGFVRLKINMGETKTAKIPLSITDLALVDQNQSYLVEPGEFQIMVGPDSRDAVLLKTILTVKT